MLGLLMGAALLAGIGVARDYQPLQVPASEASASEGPLQNATAGLLPLTIQSVDTRFVDQIGEAQVFLENVVTNTLTIDMGSGEIYWENKGSNLTSILIRNLLGLPGVPETIPSGPVMAGFSLYSPDTLHEYAGDNYHDMALLEDGSLYLPSSRLVHGVYQLWYSPIVVHPNPADDHPLPKGSPPPSGILLGTFDTNSLDIPPNELNAKASLEAPALKEGNPCSSPGARQTVYRGTTDQWTPVGSVSSPYGGLATYQNSKWEKKAIFFVAYGSAQTIGNGHSVAASDGDTRHVAQLMRWSLYDVYECSRHGTSGWIWVDNIEQVINQKPTGAVMKGELSVMGGRRETDADDVVSGTVCSGSQCYPLVWTDVRYKRFDDRQYFSTSVTETITTSHDRWIGAGLSVGHKFFGINAVDFKVEKGAQHSAQYTMPAGWVHFDYLGKVGKSSQAFCVAANGVTCP